MVTQSITVPVLAGDGSTAPLTITVTGTEPAPDRLAALEQRVGLLEERIGQLTTPA